MIDLYNDEKTTNSKTSEWLNKKFSFLKNSSSLFYYVLILIGIGLGFYVTMITQHNFTTPWGGDFVMQYIPFAYNYYDDWWYFFETGIFPHWDANIFLGADTVTSDGYYIMFSPFFVPLLFFPRGWIPQVLTLISIFRFVLAGCFFRLYLKKMDVGEKFARIGGIAYAFCGYAAFYMWFNNFLDIVVLLAATLYGIEVVLKDKKPWVLAVALGIIGIDNFFFFPAIVIMTFVYSLFRYISLFKTKTAKDNILVICSGFVGYLLAIGIGGCVLLPGLITGMSDPKIETTSYLNLLKESWKMGDANAILDLLLSWEKVPGGSWKFQTYPIVELFFPPVTCRHIPLVNAASGNTFDNTAGSLWIGLGLLMFFFPAVIQALKDKKFSILWGIGIFSFVLFTPFTYFLLFGGAKAYARWQVIFPACMIAFIIKYLDAHPKISLKMLSAGFGFVVSGIFVGGVLAHCYVNFSYNLEYWLPFPGVLFIELAYVTCLFVLFAYYYQKEKIKSLFTYVAALEAICIGVFVSTGHGSTSYETMNGGPSLNARLHETVKGINEQDDSFFRMTTSMNLKQYSDNNQNMNNYNGVSMFNTLYNYNTRLFKYWSRLSDWYGGWSATYMEKRQSLDQFLNIKYYVSEKGLLKEDKVLRPNVPFGYELDEKLSQNNFNVYKNDSLNTIGYQMDQIFTFDFENDPDRVMDENGSYPFTVLRTEEMYLDTAIMDIKDYEALDDSVKEVVPKKGLRTMGEISAKRLSNSEYSTVYYDVPDGRKYPIDQLNEIDSRYRALNSTEISQRRNNNNGNTFVVIKNKNHTTFPGTEEGAAIYLDTNFNEKHKYDVYLLDEAGKIITFDNHMDTRFYKASNRTIRSYYSDRPIAKIVIFPRDKKMSYFASYMETKTAWDNRLATYSPFENVEYVNANTFTFTTSNTKTRVGVCNIPYERGWKVYAKQGEGDYELLPTFLANGGFVGFVIPEGNISYRMEYKNPDFAMAEHITAGSYIIVIGSYCGYVIISQENERKRLLKAISFHF